MLTLEEITKNAPVFSVSINNFKNNMVSGNLSFNSIMGIIASDLNINSEVIDNYKNQINIKIKKDGLYFDTTKCLKKEFAKINVFKIPQYHVLENFVIYFSHMENYRDLRRLTDPFKGIVKIFDKNYKSKKDDFKRFQTDILDSYLYPLLNLAKVNGKKVSSLEEYLNLEKVYYYMAISLCDSKIVRNSPYSVSKYLINYLEHIRPYITEEDKLNMDFGDDKEYSVHNIIEFLEEIYNYKFKRQKEEESLDVKNITLYPYIFLDTDNTILVKERLGTFLKRAEEEQNKDLSNLLKRKVKYFLTLNPDRIVEGKNKYDGYIGFVIGDKIVLEHFFKDLKGDVIVDNEAIYIMNEENFETLTKLGKMDVIEKINNGEVLADRVYHTGAWEERVNQKLALTKE